MSMLYPRTCVAPDGAFVHGIHKPTYKATNRRLTDWPETLGKTASGQSIDNRANFPGDDVKVKEASWVYEIPNPFPFMGATFIPKGGADRRTDACNPFREVLECRKNTARAQGWESAYLDVENGPRPYLLMLAKFSQNPEVLKRIAALSCRFVLDENGSGPVGLLYEKNEAGEPRPGILDGHLFELVSNNPFLPDAYKRLMVLAPGVQGSSPIIGEYENRETHIWEYLRENSYIPWGHYAANMAQDAVRYSVGSLCMEDMVGLRHLYYQRIYLQLAEDLEVSVPTGRRSATVEELESIRHSLLDRIVAKASRLEALRFNGNIWGQNFGFDLSPSGYRLNASHQQIHQQYALVPSTVPTFRGTTERAGHFLPTFILGDLAAQFASDYRKMTGVKFFDTYLQALTHNTRVDGREDKPASLIIYEDAHLVVFVPKAQRSQGEIQMMTKGRCGNIIEADETVRASMDRAVLMVLRVLEHLGVEMLTAFEISKRYDNPDSDFRLLYCFLPKHPQSPGSFTEFQKRWIIGHYPEDYAQTCREAWAVEGSKGRDA